MAAGPMEQFEIRPLFGDHPLFSIGGHPIFFTNQALWMIIVTGAVSLFMTFAMSRRSLVPNRAQSMAELAYEFVANMINTAAGEEGLRFFPMIFTIFMFVATANFMGLLPGSFTVTSQICVTLALTMLIILTVIVTGFVTHGIGFLKLFVPKAPIYMLPVLVPLEFISFCTRPMSLSVRLFANMLAGHTMLKVMAGFVVALGAMAVTSKAWMAPLSLAPMALIVAVTGLEILVAFLQAYVFAILACIYLGEAIHLHDNH
ncbi:MAG TPA: F0F1 ATP synthase subunit A [Rhizomicrobium sp.]|jgi:F-type H+-transporting ATPase subunit a